MWLAGAEFTQLKTRVLCMIKKLLLSLLTLLTAACSPVSLINGLTPASTYEFTGGVAFGPIVRDKLDIYRPRASVQNPQPPNGYPVVVFFYGGSWNSGERGDYKFVGEALAARGIVTVIADYRLYPQVRYPDFLRDNALAVAWTRREIGRYAGDPNKLFIMGHSAGGYDAAMLALDPRWLAEVGMRPSMLSGWIGLAGPYDFLPIKDQEVRPVFFYPDYPAGSQPIDYVSTGAPPTFLAAAETDDLVNPARNTEQMAAKLKAAGVPVTLKLYSKVSHLTLIGAFSNPLHWLAPVREDVVNFVDTQAHMAPM